MLLACLLSEASASTSISTGKERDTESGNDYFGARYYASSMGRWMSPDTDFNLKRILPNPQRWNRYAYVINNPLVLVDPVSVPSSPLDLAKERSSKCPLPFWWTPDECV